MADSTQAMKVSTGIPAALERKLRRLKITVFNEVYHKQLSEIDAANKALQTILDQSLKLEPRRSRRRLQGNATSFEVIRQHARSFHAAIFKESSWRCSPGRCASIHVVSLCLEPRPWSHSEQNRSSHESPSETKFRVLSWTQDGQSRVHDLTGGVQLEAQTMALHQVSGNFSIPLAYVVPNRHHLP